MQTLSKIFKIIKILHDLKSKGFGVSYLHTHELFFYTLRGKGIDAYARLELSDPETPEEVSDIYTHVSGLTKGKEYTTWKGRFYPPQDNTIDRIL